MHVSFLMSSTGDQQRSIPIEDDLVTIGLIRESVQEQDLGLFATKWFDYRLMTPLQATRLYMEMFGQVYKTIYAREIDAGRAPYVQGMNLDKVLDGLSKGAPSAKTKMTAAWRGRQVADALGMPYALYIELAFTYRMRRWKRPYLPSLQHLYHEYDVEKIQARWDELQEAQLFLAENPAYLLDNYQALNHQNDYHEWLLKQAFLRNNPPFYLAEFVRAGHLPFEKIEGRYGHLLDQVRSYIQ